MSKSRDRSTSRVHSSAKRQSQKQRFLVETLEGRVLLAGDITIEAGVAGSITTFSVGGGVNDTLLAQISARRTTIITPSIPPAFATLIPDGADRLLATNGHIDFLATTGAAADTINLPQSVDMTVQAGNDIVFGTSINFSGSLTFNSGVAGDASDRDAGGASDILVVGSTGQTGLVGTGTTRTDSQWPGDGSERSSRSGLDRRRRGCGAGFPDHRTRWSGEFKRPLRCRNQSGQQGHLIGHVQYQRRWLPGCRAIGRFWVVLAFGCRNHRRQHDFVVAGRSRHRGPRVNTAFGDNVTLYGLQITISNTVNDSGQSLGLSAVEGITQAIGSTAGTGATTGRSMRISWYFRRDELSLCRGVRPSSRPAPQSPWTSLL